MITIKNICTTFSTLENGCRFFFFPFLADSNRYENKTEGQRWILRGDEVEKELYIGGTKQLVMYQKKRSCLLNHFQSVCMADVTFLVVFSYLVLFKQIRARGLYESGIMRS